MAVQLVALNNLGAEFDIGVIEAAKIHVRPGTGLRHSAGYNSLEIDPTTIAVAVQNSITGTGATGSPLELVNDAAAPGAVMYYGTDVTGTKGWFSNGVSTDAGQVLTNGTDGRPFLDAEAIQDAVGQAILAGLGITYDDALNAISATAASWTYPQSVQNAAGVITLVNDAAAPGASMYYGTNPAGTKGWYATPLPATAAPINDSVAGAVVGTSTDYARADHVHAFAHSLTWDGTAGLAYTHNGDTVTVATPAGTIANLLGYDALGAPVQASVLSISPALVVTSADGSVVPTQSGTLNHTVDLVVDPTVFHQNEVFDAFGVSYGWLVV